MSLSVEEIEKIAIEVAVEAAERAAHKAVDSAARKAATIAVSEASMDEECIEAVVHQTLLQMGVDSENPLESQKDFQHLRQWRKSGEELRSKGTVALITIFISGLVALAVLGLKQWFHL